MDAEAAGGVSGPGRLTLNASPLSNSVSDLEMPWSSHAGLGIGVRLSHFEGMCLQEDTDRWLLYSLQCVQRVKANSRACLAGAELLALDSLQELSL